MILSLELKNFRCFGEFSINFAKNRFNKTAKNLVLIYGENGIGKSSIIDAIKFLTDSRDSIATSMSYARSLSILPELSQDVIRDFLLYQQDQNRIKDLAEDRVQFGSNEPASISYQAYVGRHSYRYTISFTSSAVEMEQLSIDGQPFFIISPSVKSLRVKNHSDQTMPEPLRDICSMYYGQHSFLSCLNYWLQQITPQFAEERFGTAFTEVFNDIQNLKCSSSQAPSALTRIRSSTLLTDLVQGRCPADFETRRQKTEKVLSAFYRSLTDNIISVHYETQLSENETEEYALYFIRKAPAGRRKVPYHMESFGTKRLLRLFCLLYGLVHSSGSVFVDEFDAGIHDLLTKRIVDSVKNEIEGQFITTTHNTHLMSHLNKNSCYILNREEDQTTSVYSLEKYGRGIQSKTNVLQRYMDGVYGGVPAHSAFNFAEILSPENE